MSRYDTLVIGGGVNGLAAAATLARARQRVLVVEKRERVGGTLVTEEFHPGFRANLARDDPGWVPESLLRGLRLGRHGLSVAPAEAGLVIPRDGAAPLVTWRDRRRTVRELRGASPPDAARWADFCGFVERAASFLELAYSQRPPRVQSGALRDLWPLVALGRRLRGFGRREMMEVLRAIPMPIADLLDEWFESPALKGALATLGIRDVMHGPMSGGTALVFFHQHVGTGGEVAARRVIRGGVGALADAVAAAAQRAGAEVRSGVPVREILVSEGRAAGVRLDTGERIEVDRVVSSVDVRRTFALVDPQWLDPEFLRAVDHVRMRGASARVHFALEAAPPFASDGKAWPQEWLSGTIVSSPGVQGTELAYDYAKYGELPDAPAVTLAIPSVSDPSLAPTGRHVVSATVHHIPYHLRRGWNSAARGALGDLVQSRLETLAPGFGERVRERLVLSPADLEDRFGVSEGSLTQGEIALDQILFMRPVPQCARYATPLAGLWICGTGTHPASVAGASGVLAAREVLA